MSKHTPGPWYIVPDPDFDDAVAIATEPTGDNCWYVASVTNNCAELEDEGIATPEQEVAANAHLIAAAPSLLAACKALLFTVNPHNGLETYAYKRDVYHAWGCCYCHNSGDYPKDIDHLDDCPVAIAQVAIAKAEATE